MTQFFIQKLLKETYMRLLFLILTILSLKAGAQTEEEAVKKPIVALFDGMRKSDTTLLRSAFAPTSILQTIGRNKEGKTVIRTDDVNKFIEAVGKPQEQVLDERITFETIKIDGNLAIVWTPYQFYIGQTFSHCGVNSFQLVKLDGEWKIQYLIDTRRKEGCK
jgi:ATP-dependent exoDNAse (exonuclease V) alpha subunit